MEALFRPIIRNVPDASATICDPISRIKVMSLGESGVGKSCLIKRYCENRFLDRYISTIGIDYGVRECRVGGRPVKVNFWDASGRKDYLEIRNEFYKDAQCVLLMYDTSNRQSFASLNNWLAEAAEFGLDQTKTTLVLIGTKTDKTRAVKTEEGQRWADTNRCRFFETSSKSGTGVIDALDAAFLATCKRVWADE